MFKSAFSLCLLCLMLVAQPATPAGNDTGGKKKQIIMGGTTLGIRTTAQQDMEIAFNVAVREYLKSSDTDLKIVIFPSTQELYAAFDKREIDGIFGTPIEYLGRETQYGKDIMALGHRSAGVKQSFVLIARSGDGIGRIDDLKDKRLTLARYQDIEEVYLNTLLLKAGLAEIPGFFSARIEAKNSNIAIMDVFFNKSDITIVLEREFATAIELNPQLGRKLFILSRSPPLVPAMGSVRKDIDRESIAALKTALKRYGNNDKGNRVLSASQASSIEDISTEDVQGVRDLLREYQSLRQSSRQKPAPSLPAASETSRRNAQ